jgi:hypothetical protein
MTSPIVVGVAAIVAVPIHKARSIVRFQNVGVTTIYLKKVPLSGAFSVVSPTDFEIILLPATGTAEGGDAFETNSIASFMAISSAAAGSLSIYETVKA